MSKERRDVEKGCRIRTDDPSRRRPRVRKCLQWHGGVAVALIFLTGLIILGLVSEGIGGKESIPRFPSDVRSRGNPKAPVTLIEYSDFTCGFCKKFFVETWPRIHTKYVETGKLRFLYRDYPRASQGPALEAAVAARCAGDQGRYWSMHDRLFEGRLQRAEFQRHAKSMGLDLTRFTSCMQETRHIEDIFRDKEEGMELGFRGTPGFLLMKTDSPTKEPAIAIPGAFPFEVFEEQIDRLLRPAFRQ